MFKKRRRDETVFIFERLDGSLLQLTEEYFHHHRKFFVWRTDFGLSKTAAQALGQQLAKTLFGEEVSLHRIDCSVPQKEPMPDCHWLVESIMRRALARISTRTVLVPVKNEPLPRFRKYFTSRMLVEQVRRRKELLRESLSEF